MNMENVSAFMVHHVLHPSKNIKRSAKRKAKKQRKQTALSPSAIDGVKKPKEFKPRGHQLSANSLKMKSNGGKTQAFVKPVKGERHDTKLGLSNVFMKSKSAVSFGSKGTTHSPETKQKLVSFNEAKQKSDGNSETKQKFTDLTFEQHFEKKTLFQWMISPVDAQEFMNTYWEKKPLHISKSHSKFSLLLNTPLIDKLLTTANIQYTKNVDITFYANGVRETHNLEGRARPHVVWDVYCSGCSLRMLNPQTFVPNIHKLNSELQEYFGCFVGCNAYLTPPHSQGFAPHYDDIEAFILQIEGKKRWRVYEPRTPNEVLPRYSSGNFTDTDLGEPIFEVLLNEGDVLYLPRGYIHQATTEQDFHSLHITVSAYQCNAWIDLLQKVIPEAVENAWKKDVEFRKGLPLDYLQAAGLARGPKHKKTRMMMESNLKSLICKLADHIQIDSAVDKMAADFLYDALPPVLTEEEKQCSVYGGGLKMVKNGKILGATEFEFREDMEIVLLRKFVSRLVKTKVEEGTEKKRKTEYRLYYTTDNSLEYHGEQTSFSIVPKHFISCVQYLFQCYPQYVVIKELPHDDMDAKINFVADLWERGIIRTRRPIIITK